MFLMAPSKPDLDGYGTPCVFPEYLHWWGICSDGVMCGDSEAACSKIIPRVNTALICLSGRGVIHTGMITLPSEMNGA